MFMRIVSAVTIGNLMTVKSIAVYRMPSRIRHSADMTKDEPVIVSSNDNTRAVTTTRHCAGPGIPKRKA